MADDFNVPMAFEAIMVLARRCIGIIVLLVVALTCLNTALDYYYADEAWSGILSGIADLVLCYLLANALAEHSGLTEGGRNGPGFPAYFGLSLIEGIAVGIATLFLLIPGILLSVKWIFSFPILFDRDKSDSVSDALSGSWDLTSGRFGALFTVYLVSVVPMILGLVTYALFDPAEQSLYLAQVVAANFFLAVGVVSSMLAAFGCYLLVRGDAETLSDIFA